MRIVRSTCCAATRDRPKFLAVNRRGKVPALIVDGRLLTENAAILLFLADRCAPGMLLPGTPGSIEWASAVSDLIWCSLTVHPVVRSIRIPIRMTDGDPDAVKSRGLKLMTPIAQLVEGRLQDGPWWFGQAWSILDVYLYWNYETARSGGFDLDACPTIAAHAERVRSRPSFQRALARERTALERAGITLPPGAEL